MSTIERSACTATLAPLVEGQRLDQATFHERYEQMPPGTRAELINGVVHMPGPIGPEHGRATVAALVWLSYYQENTPGVDVLDNVLREGRLVGLPPDSEGIFRSESFPGLWLDPRALIEGNTRRLREVLDRGLATTEHSAFVARLAAARAGS